MNRQAPRTTPSEAPCADCARLFDGEIVLPAIYADPVPEITPTARRSVHERALREGISHDEAVRWVYWEAFPAYHVVPPEGAFGKDGVPSHP